MIFSNDFPVRENWVSTSLKALAFKLRDLEI